MYGFVVAREACNIVFLIGLLRVLFTTPFFAWQKQREFFVPWIIVVYSFSLQEPILPLYKNFYGINGEY
jgi:hypothetical protein